MNQGEDASAKDNAAGALARMLAANAAPLPVSEALQVRIRPCSPRKRQT